MNEITINLPWPPSVNAVWKTTARGKFAHIYKTEEGKKYCARVGKILMMMGKPSLGNARLSMVVEAYPPDRRRRDLGNLDKVLSDALQAAGVFDDDEQIDDMRYVRHAIEAPGRVIVHLQIIEAKAA